MSCGYVSDRSTVRKVYIKANVKQAASPHFYQQLQRFGERPAAIEAEVELNYRQLAERCESFAERLQQPGLGRQLVFIKAHNSIATLISYVSCLQQHHVVVLLDPQIAPERLAALIAAYQPHCLIEQGQIERAHSRPLPLAPELALLLSTSGSTGSPKQVCLSAANLQANAASICAYLPIEVSDRTITTLPFQYSYGLSVINSQLLAGSCIVFNQHSLLSREFWQQFKQQQISSFAGVPYSYEMLLKLRFTRMELTHLRYFTQAGGKLAAESVRQLAEYAKATDKQFFVMYGQTEATARMAYVASEQVLLKPESIGRAIPGGEFSLRDAKGQTIDTPMQSGELIYRGANVMLGYASNSAQLAQFSPLSELATGDIAYRDADGDYVICGRLKRFIKISGLRINLDEVESLLQQQGYQCYCVGDDTTLKVALLAAQETKPVQMWLSRQLGIHFQAIEVHPLDVAPLSANGKVDYPALNAQLTEANA